MSWTDFYRRRDILEAAIRQAGRAPAEPLALRAIPGAVEMFGTEENLLLALHYKWSQLLSGYLRAELAEPEDAFADGGEDRIDAVSRAWRRARAEHEALRALLDHAVPRCAALVPLHEGELRVLAMTAGLAESSEPREKITDVGRALDALVRAGDVRPTCRLSPINHLKRLLATSA
jgi:hypothetical protein